MGILPAIFGAVAWILIAHQIRWGLGDPGWYGGLILAQSCIATNYNSWLLLDSKSK